MTPNGKPSRKLKIPCANNTCGFDPHHRHKKTPPACLGEFLFYLRRVSGSNSTARISDKEHHRLGVHIKTEKQKLPHKNTVRQLLLFICCVPCVCRQFRSALFLLCERAFLPAAFVARLSHEWPFVLPKSRTLPGKKHRKTASAIYSAVSYRFYNVFCKKGFTNEFQKHII